MKAPLTRRGFFVCVARMERSAIRRNLSRVISWSLSSGAHSGDPLASSGQRIPADQFTRVQVWPPQNMPPNAQPWTRSVSGLFIAMVES
ncbi:hypothetical protein ABIF29_003878 [Bradyrhizobium elkanii]|uniref:Uncharacterized protein n=1 Tax=Bradyrhizobium elkanii TaxID=29448 RepID=A0ABV4F0X3_BRAEL